MVVINPATDDDAIAKQVKSIQRTILYRITTRYIENHKGGHSFREVVNWLSKNVVLNLKVVPKC